MSTEAAANESAELVRQAYDAFSNGDTQALLRLVDPDLDWVYLDPSQEDPQPQTCHGRQELEAMLDRQAQRGLASELEEIAGNGDRVAMVVRTAGIDAYRVRHADDRNFTVLTVENGRITRLHDYPNREAAFAALTRQ